MKLEGDYQQQKQNWIIEFGWLKAPIEVYGYELAKHLAKQALRQGEVQSFTKMMFSILIQKQRAENKDKW
jgi:hypothetical protein